MRAEHEAEDRFRGVAPLGVRPFLDVGEARARRELGRENPLRRQLVDDRGHVNERMTRVVVGEHALIRGFELVVELLDEPGAQLLDERLRIETREHQRDGAEQEVGVVQVGADRVVDAGVLHLHRDFEAATCHRPGAPARSTPPRAGPDPTPRTRARERRRARRARPRFVSSVDIGGASCCKDASASRTGSGMPSSR